ncbi:sugar transferase [Winogradskyella jejuensis]|uniref:Sugar transferase involved in LPS biosynthesis (Colanic, teichoic acid) n=1 Tax=Winogradskyella jejuensis TaxID=1089305 RepID=A0A1M5MT54_9FLAO|nr:sugar transferase [Winogradskyella jejuensis]SHG80421.1 Sugar transferase involved in LPS biosynthesis (colanic, teichoic acid) [Winogradskyella jejuensis]
MNKKDIFLKRTFDLLLSIIGLICFGWLILLASLISFFDTGMNGFYTQQRVGQFGRVFKVYKIRSMKNIEGVVTTVSTDNDPRITKVGRFWRKTKIDELPQLYNVLIGDMSFVGPRPDVKGFADKLEGDDRVILTIKPGITGPASIYYRNEEEILSNQNNPELYNKTIIWPKKVDINKSYIKNYSFFKDIEYIVKTVL